MHRLFIVLPVYALVVVFLPQNPGFDEFTRPLRAMHPDIAIAISVVSGLIAGGLILLARRVELPWAYSRPRLLQAFASGLVGVIIASVFDVFERLAGQATNIVTLIILPIAFFMSEAAYQAIQWRLNRSAEDADQEN